MGGYFEDKQVYSFFDDSLFEDNALSISRIRAVLMKDQPVASGVDSVSEVRSLLEDASDDTTTLDLSGRELSALPDRLFELRKLESLNLSDNDLSGADPRLATLQKLQHLDVSDNGQWSAHDELGVIEELRSLKSLSVRGFNPSDAIAQLSKLELLDAEEVGFPLPDAFFALQHLRSLRIQSPLSIASKKNDLPEALGSFTKLERLVIGQGTYAVLPDALSTLSKLEHLELGCSFRKRGVPALDGLKKLKTFIFDGAPFDDNTLNTKWLEDILEALEGSSVTHLSLPRWGRKLKHRRASGKQIDRPALGALPDNFGSLTELVELDLSDNGLKDLPESLFSLKLSRLDVRDNDLSADTLKRARDAFNAVQA